MSDLSWCEVQGCGRSKSGRFRSKGADPARNTAKGRVGEGRRRGPFKLPHLRPPPWKETLRVSRLNRRLPPLPPGAPKSLRGRVFRFLPASPSRSLSARDNNPARDVLKAVGSSKGIAVAINRGARVVPDLRDRGLPGSLARPPRKPPADRENRRPAKLRRPDNLDNPGNRAKGREIDIVPIPDGGKATRAIRAESRVQGRGPPLRPREDPELQVPVKADQDIFERFETKERGKICISDI